MRRPVLIPGVCGGTAVPDARRTRVFVKDGAVLVHRARSDSDAVLAPAGTVTRVVQVAPTGLRWPFSGSVDGLFAIMAGPDPVLLFDPRDWTAHPEALSGRDLRSVCGVEPLAQALGLTVEAADAAETAAVRKRVRHILRPRPDVNGGREDFVLVGSIAVTFLGMPLSDRGVGLAMTVVGFLLAAPTVVRLRRRRLEFRELVTTPPDPDGRHVIGSCLGPEWAGLSRSHLHVGADYIVHQARGKEVWVAGPALGGAVRCVAGADDLAFLDSADRVVLRVDARAFHTNEVASACRLTGVEFESTPLYVGAPSVPLGTLALAGADSTMSESEYGSTTVATPALGLCASVMLLVGSLLGLRWSPVAGILVVAAVVLLAMTIHSWRLLKGWWVADRARPTPHIPDGGR